MLLTINISPKHPQHNAVFASPKSKPNNFSDSTSLPRQRKIETVKCLLVKIKSINNLKIHNKFHLNNRVYIFRSIHKCFKVFHQTLQPLITPLSHSHDKIVIYAVYHLVTFIHCHLSYFTFILLHVWNISVNAQVTILWKFRRNSQESFLRIRGSSQESF